MVNIESFLLHRAPFLFIDQVDSYTDKEIKGKVIFDRYKYTYQNKVDLFDLIESCAQLCGLHIGLFSKQQALGYLSKIYQVNNLKDSYKNSYNFVIQNTLQDSMGALYSYSSKIYNNDQLILDINLAIMLEKNLNLEQADNNLLVNNNKLNLIDEVFEVFLQLNDGFEVSFDKNADLFKGHFPNYPIVPGIYVLKTACIILLKQNYIKFNINNIKAIKNCKFFNLIKPNEKVVFFINQQKSNEFLIKVVSKNNNVLKATFNIIL